jgi:very-short-patch-repair endonuclease
LRNRRLGGFKSGRQCVVGAFIADFYCDEVKLIVELDGDTHAGREQHDGIRTTILERDADASSLSRYSGRGRGGDG